MFLEILALSYFSNSEYTATSKNYLQSPNSYNLQYHCHLIKIPVDIFI